MALVVLLCSLLLASGAVAQGAPAPGPGEGDFRVQNYATGTGNGNFVYRGYLFRPSRDVVVTGMWGGFGPNCSEFGGAIFEATLTGGGTSDVPEFEIGDVVREVRFEDGVGNTPEFREFDSSATLSDDSYYVIAQGRIAGGSGCHFNTDSLDFQNLLIGSPILAEWFPQEDAQYNIGGTGEPEGRVGQTVGFTDNIRILVGFRYETDSVAADLTDVQTTAFQLAGSNNVVVSGNLSDSGLQDPDEELTLYFEFADNDSFDNATLVPAQPFTVTGPQTDVPFGATLEDLDDGVQYWVRAVAINEAGRVDANPLSFTVGSMDEGFEVTTSVVTVDDASGTVTPQTRAVAENETTTFGVFPASGSEVSDISSTCGTGSLVGNTYTTAEVTEPCSVEFTFAPMQEIEPVAVPVLGRNGFLWLLIALTFMLGVVMLRARVKA
ncbi:hypothetical protein [Wenzhouxiangella sp. AB-CW3]|uniref:hypothetical protein n=1 Tax=Wenzhouxiangella sp. AB-CW3 TaxID=2771012 RepID=UPI001CC2CE67|nr:hypothetical protein [Wenzhouxiangella sp. AB-CW3]